MKNDNNILTPSVGMMLTDGAIYSDMVFVGALDDAERWREVPMAEYEAWVAAQEVELNNRDDYETGR